jgi:hypothetical protein
LRKEKRRGGEVSRVGECEQNGKLLLKMRSRKLTRSGAVVLQLGMRKRGEDGRGKHAEKDTVLMI